MSEDASAMSQDVDHALVRELEGHAFLRDAHGPVLRRLATISQEKSFSAGSMLFREGQPADTLFLLVTGLVALELHLPGKGTMRLESLGAGDIAGLSWLFPPYRWHLDARAIEPVTALAVDGQKLRAWMSEDLAVGQALGTRLVHQLYQRLERVRMQRLDLYKAEP